MHNPEFTFPLLSCRTLHASLVSVLLLFSASGCQEKPRPATESAGTAPAENASADKVISEPAESDQNDASVTLKTDLPPPGQSTAAKTDAFTRAPEKLQLKQPPAPEANAETSVAPNGETIERTDPAETGEAPDVDAVMGDDQEYPVDPELQAHIQAQERALRRIADAYAAPPGAKQLGKQPDLWVDMKAKRVYVDGYVALRRGPLEMFACPVGTKEHESVVAVFAKSSEVHAALLAVGAQSGTPVRWNPDFLPPTGQIIQVWATWRSPEPATALDINGRGEGEGDQSNAAKDFVPGDEFHAVDAREWIRDMKTKRKLAEPWVFAGSTFWSDPEDNVEHYSADAGDMICVSNFTSAMLDVPFRSSADAGNVLFEPFTENIPQRGTPVRLVLVPQPIPGDEDAKPVNVDPAAPPEKTMLPIGKPKDQEKLEATK